jgi:uncharacterized membrane protein (UPF0127 family)
VDAAVLNLTSKNTLPLKKSPLPQHHCSNRVITKITLKMRVRNRDRGTVLAEAADVADTSAKRRTGLLKHTGLAPGEGLWIAPCEAVHSFGMKFAIDVVYLDRKKRVRKLRKQMVPRRLSACLTAHSVLELPVGVIDASQTRQGDQLEFEKVE